MKTENRKLIDEVGAERAPFFVSGPREEEGARQRAGGHHARQGMSWACLRARRGPHGWSNTDRGEWKGNEDEELC